MKTPKPPPLKPVSGLSDPRFIYVPAAKTDIRKTFQRIRAEQARKESK